MERMMIGLNRQEYNTLLNEMNEGKHLYEYRDDFIITETYEVTKGGVVMLTIIVKDAGTAFYFGKWIAAIHTMQKHYMGENYTIDPNWKQKVVESN